MAERGGFEPPEPYKGFNGFRNRPVQPLRHLSAREIRTVRARRPPGSASPPQPARSRRISSSSGKRSSWCLEKISFPSTTTSKIPPPPLISFALTPVAFLIAAARPAARGSKFHCTQYSIEMRLGAIASPPSGSLSVLPAVDPSA